MAWQQLPLRDALCLPPPRLTLAKPYDRSADCSPGPYTSGLPYTTLQAWSSFDAKVDKFVQELTEKFPTAMVYDTRELRPDTWRRYSYVCGESDVRELFVSQILNMTTDLLEAMKCPGFAVGSIPPYVYGLPDKIWVLDEYSPAVMCIEIKTPWYLKNVTNIIEQSASTNCDRKLRASIEQIYDYMVVSS
jgi:hypothetical protein